MRQSRRGKEPHAQVAERTPATPLPRDITLMPPFDDADRMALIALKNGTASPTQQKRALGWVLFASGYTDVLYRPGGSDVRDFVLGRHSVSEAIIAVLSSPSLGKPDADREQG